MKTCLVLLVLGFVSMAGCQGRAPNTATIDAGPTVVVEADAGQIVDREDVDAGPTPAGYVSGICLDGRHVLPNFRSRFDDERPQLIDCEALGSSCELGFAGCVGQPGEVCSGGNMCRLGEHLDGCARRRCPDQPVDSHAFSAPTALNLPTDLLVVLDHIGDQDCFTFRNSGLDAMLAIEGLSGSRLPTVVDVRPQKTLTWGGGVLASIPLGDVKVCFRDNGLLGGERVHLRLVRRGELSTLEDTGINTPGGSICAGTVVGVSVRSTEEGIAFSTGRCTGSSTGPCVTHTDCVGACRQDTISGRQCGVPVDERVFGACVDTGAGQRFVGRHVAQDCPSSCVPGVGCIGFPGGVCLVGPPGEPSWCPDALGGLNVCATGICPRLALDDAPGFYVAGKSISPDAPLRLQAETDGDVDCVVVVDAEAPTWVPVLDGPGSLSKSEKAVVDGGRILWSTKMCISEHAPETTLTFEPCPATGCR